MRKILFFTIFIVFLLLLIKFVVITLENRFTFFPDSKITSTPKDIGLDFTDVQFQSIDGVKLSGWFIPGNEDSPLVLYFHGNSGNMSSCVDFLNHVKVLGFSWFLLDYRQYGKSKGEISEEGFYKDVEAAYRLCKRKYLRDGTPLVLWGYSLGSVAAVYLASREDVSCLVLEAPIISVSAVASKNPFWEFFYYFSDISLDNSSRIKFCGQPKLFIHGTADAIVPPFNSRVLYEISPPHKEAYFIKNAHHRDLFIVGGDEYLRRISSYIRKYAIPESEVRE